MLIGIFIGVIFMVMLFLCVYIGYKLQTKHKPLEQTDEEKRTLRLRDEGFENIFNFDYDVALGKRVNK